MLAREVTLSGNNSHFRSRVASRLSATRCGDNAGNFITRIGPIAIKSICTHRRDLKQQPLERGNQRVSRVRGINRRIKDVVFCVCTKIDIIC